MKAPSVAGAILLAAALALGTAPREAFAHTESANLGDLPVLLYEPEVSLLVPGQSVTKVLNTTMNGRIAWWTVVVCHCEQFRVRFSIEGPPGAYGEESLITPPTYHHYAMYWIHWNGQTTLTWQNMGNRSVVIETRAGVWVDTPASPSVPAGGSPVALETVALGTGLAALVAGSLWAWRVPEGKARSRSRGNKAPARPPQSPGALLAFGIALALVASGLATHGTAPAAAQDEPAAPSWRAAPPPEANLTVVKIQAPLAAATVSDTVAIRGIAYVNESEALRLGMSMTVDAVFMSFNFGPFEPAAGVAEWNFTWNTTPFENGWVWVGAAALDSMGNYSYDWIKVYVSNGAHPVAQASAAVLKGFAPFAASFTGSATDADGTVVRLGWQFGDGESSEGPSVNHMYLAPGRYKVTLTAVDNRGTLGRAFLNMTVLDPAGRPQCTPSAVIQQGPEALTVSFTGEAFDDGSVVSADWAFGDGEVAAGFNVSHTYTAAGNYTVTMTVRDDEGNTGSSAIMITVPEPLRQRTDFPNLRGGPGAPDVRGLLEVYTGIPAGRRVSVILPPLRPGDTIEWRFVACACAGLQNLSFWVEAPSGERLLPVAVETAGALVIGWNAVNVSASGVYQLVWENGGPGEAEVGYTVRTTTRQAPESSAGSMGPVLTAAAAAWAGAAVAAGVGVVRRRASPRRRQDPQGAK